MSLSLAVGSARRMLLATVPVNRKSSASTEVTTPGWFPGCRSALRVSVISYRDGSQALEVLPAGPPRHTGHTIDHRRFTRPGAPAARTLPVAGQSG